MTDRWALAPAEDGGVEIAPLGPDGLLAGPVLWEPDLATAVRGRPEVVRWVWRSTAEVYPRLLATGVRVERCYDIKDAETLLLGHEGRYGEPRSAAAALARLRGGPVPPDPPQQKACRCFRTVRVQRSGGRQRTSPALCEWTRSSARSIRAVSRPAM